MGNLTRAQRLADLNRQRRRMETNNKFNLLPDLSPTTVAIITVVLAVVFAMFRPGARRPDFQDWPAKMKVEAREGYTGLVYDKRVGYSLQVQRDVPPNRSLIEVPYAACIDVSTVDESVIGRKWLTPHAAVFQQELGDDESLLHTAKLVLFVLVHGRQGDYSPWYDWIHATIPTNLMAEPMWGPKMARRCLSVDALRAWESSVAAVGRIYRSIMALIDANDDVLEFTRQVDFSDVAWAYTVVKTRGWARPAPRHLMLVPLIDRVDMRCNVHQQRKHPHRVNSAAFFDDDTQMVYLLSVGHIKKGALALTSYGKHMFPTDALRLYGFVDKTFTVFRSYMSFVEEGKEPLQELAAKGCYDARNLFFFRNGTPSAALYGCAEAQYGADKAAAAILDHVNDVLDTTHSAGKYQHCLDLKQDSHDETALAVMDVRGATEFLELEDLLREAFTRAQLFLSAGATR
jgi:hypothetical protein